MFDDVDEEVEFGGGQAGAGEGLAYHSLLGEAAPELVIKGTGESLEMFGSSRSAWLRTYQGVWFIPAGDSNILLWPRPGTGLWDVAEAPRRCRWRRP